MTKEEQILDYMKKLDLSREEAEQLWQDDNDDYIGDEGEEMTKKAKQVRRYEKSDKPRKKVERKRKVDETKKALMAVFREALKVNEAELLWQLSETELNFNIGDENYTVKLTKHRTPKAKPDKKDVVDFTNN